MKKKVTKNICIFVSFLLAFFIMCNIVSGVSYSIMFKRFKAIDYNITPGLINYEEVKDELKRQEYTYKSNDETITGYYYKTNDKMPLIVVSSGYNDTSDSLLNYHKYFVSLGYNVFSYDGCGKGKSSGKQNGFFQSLLDLESTLEFIDNQKELTDMPIYLFGYSAGGFAVTSIFNIADYNIKASVSISGYNNAYTLMIDKAYKKAGFITYIGLPAINIIQNIKFKGYTKYSATSGINNTTTPFLIMHGDNDQTIVYNETSIYSCKSKITNNNVTYKIFENKTHTSILYNDEAILYQQEVTSHLNSLKSYEEKVNYVFKVDDDKYSGVNLSLLDEVITFYNKYI